jgi:energy-coupling factor transporter ATP-binding protein EcfA2
MLTAKHLQVRAGSRLLMEDVTFRVAPGDRVGLVGRNGAGKTTLTKALAGEALPAAGSITRSGRGGLPAPGPAPGDLTVTARDRILSARGLDEIVRDLRELRGLAMASEDEARSRSEPCGATPASTPSSPPPEGMPPSPRPPPSPAPSASRSASSDRRWEPSPAVSGAASSWPGSSSRGRDAAARRADQPPRRRLHRLAARPPQGLQGRARRHLARRRPARRGGQQGLPPRRQPRRARPVQPGLEGLPPSARPTSAAASGSAPTPRRRPPC